MTLTGWIEILLVLTLVLGVAWPLGAFMADVFDGRRSFLSPIVGPLERRIGGVIPVMAIAGSLAQQKKIRLSAGASFPHGQLFFVPLLAVALAFTLLKFFPFNTLGPVAEHALIMGGRRV